MRLRVKRVQAPLIAMAMSLVVAGCSVFGIPIFDDGSGGDVYTGDGSATIIVTTEQIGCCYMEGSLRFAKLDGPSSFDWDVDDGSGGSGDIRESFVIGKQRHSVMPGAYILTAWEEVCDGNCDYLDGPTNHCNLAFDAPPGATVRIRVSYTIPEPCVATLE